MDLSIQSPPEVFGPPAPEPPRNPLDGLTFDEAAEGLREYGENVAPRLRARPFAMGIVQLLRLPETLLTLAAALCLYLEKAPGQAVMPALAGLCAALGLARGALAARTSKALVQPVKMAAVRRLGKLYIIESAKVVPGDIVCVNAGDIVPADLRLIAGTGLELDESRLTGVPSRCPKSAPAPRAQSFSRENMLFAGTYVLSGRGEGFVTATGKKTALAKSKPKPERQRHAPAERAAAKALRPAHAAALAVAVAVVLGGFLRGGRPEYSVAAAVIGTTPLAAAAWVRVILARSSAKMRGGGLLICGEQAAQAVGQADVICAGKSAFTRGALEVRHSFGDKALLANAFYLCNDSRVSAGGDYFGDPVDIALRRYCEKLGVAPMSPRVGEAGFDPSRRMMSTVHEAAGGLLRQYTKGAVGAVLERCGSIYRDGRVEPLTDLLREMVVEECCAAAGQGLLTIAAAWRDHQGPPEFSHDELEKGMTFIGFCALSDPIRTGVSAFVERAGALGARTVLVTGEHPDAACAIGQTLGLFETGGRVMTSGELAAADEYELHDALDGVDVFARALPRQRTRISGCHALKGRTVLSTVHSAEQALHSRGTGTAVALPSSPAIACGRADAIVESGGFAAIASAVAESRKAFETVRRVLAFSLTARLALLLTVAAGAAAGAEVMSSPAIVLACLLCEGLSVTGLILRGFEGDARTLERPGVLFTRGAAVDILWRGALAAALSLYSYWIGSGGSPQTGAACVFVTLSLSLSLLTFMAFGAMPSKSRAAAVLAAAHAALAVAAVYAGIGFSPPGAVELLISAILAAVVLPVCLLVRRLEGRRRRR